MSDTTPVTSPTDSKTQAQPSPVLSSETPLETVDKVLQEHLDTRSQFENSTEHGGGEESTPQTTNPVATIGENTPPTLSQATLAASDREIAINEQTTSNEQPQASLKKKSVQAIIDGDSSDDWQEIVDGAIASNSEANVEPETTPKPELLNCFDGLPYLDDLNLGEESMPPPTQEESFEAINNLSFASDYLSAKKESRASQGKSKPKNTNPPSSESLAQLVNEGIGSQAQTERRNSKGKKPRPKQRPALTKVLKLDKVKAGDFGKHGQRIANRYKSPSDIIDPDKDGINHINVFAFAKTELGRLLDPNARSGFSYPHLGSFNSIGGLWAYLLSENNDSYRALHGNRIKKVLRDLPHKHVENFKLIIAEATWIKVLNSENLVNKIIESKGLPFKRYYLRDKAVVEVMGLAWYMDVLERIRANIILNNELVIAGISSESDETPELVAIDFSDLK